VPGAELTDRSPVDFGAGTTDGGAYVARSRPGEVILRPKLVGEFTGDELRNVLLDSSFSEIQVHGQWVSPRYRYVPFLLVERRCEPAALVWKLQNRLPFRAKDGLARLLTGYPFYPGEKDYAFVPGTWAGAHALLALAR
jgi:hypothetical protein